MSDKQVGTVRSGAGDKERCVILEIDREYVIKPHNPRKLKHRDRACVLLGLVSEKGEGYPPDYAKVRFLDTNRQGHAELGELVPRGELYDDELID